MGVYFVGLNPPHNDINRLCLCEEGTDEAIPKNRTGHKGAVPSVGIGVDLEEDLPPPELVVSYGNGQ